MFLVFRTFLGILCRTLKALLIDTCMNTRVYSSFLPDSIDQCICMHWSVIYVRINSNPTPTPLPQPRTKVRDGRVFDKIWQHVLPVGVGISQDLPCSIYSARTGFTSSNAAVGWGHWWGGGGGRDFNWQVYYCPWPPNLALCNQYGCHSLREGRNKQCHPESVLDPSNADRPIGYRLPVGSVGRVPDCRAGRSWVFKYLRRKSLCTAARFFWRERAAVHRLEEKVLPLQWHLQMLRLSSLFG